MKATKPVNARLSDQIRVSTTANRKSKPRVSEARDKFASCSKNIGEWS